MYMLLCNVLFKYFGISLSDKNENNSKLVNEGFYYQIVTTSSKHCRKYHHCDFMSLKWYFDKSFARILQATSIKVSNVRSSTRNIISFTTGVALPHEYFEHFGFLFQDPGLHYF